jgi:hypothetical protein
LARNDVLPIQFSNSQEDVSLRSRGALRPSDAEQFASRIKRAQETPGARCTRSLACEIKKHTSIVTTGPPDFTRHFLRNGFNGLFRALPGDEFVLSPSLAD